MITCNKGNEFGSAEWFRLKVLPPKDETSTPLFEEPLGLVLRAGGITESTSKGAMEVVNIAASRVLVCITPTTCIGTVCIALAACGGVINTTPTTSGVVNTGLVSFCVITAGSTSVGVSSIGSAFVGVSTPSTRVN
jgi:hypothetical protein